MPFFPSNTKLLMTLMTNDQMTNQNKNNLAEEVMSI